ncbi:hypothetical protein Hypma_008888 [Hypsizygus marmoreus]|uniref:Uncharacterized protein n=1 Tax=Hypsizygus marmoreus TaxID=39966 RepID=A0A369JT61_HYPMA|nr:hypothetical protein Hypma_008888 [Hypsizygus marmoreus]
MVTHIRDRSFSRGLIINPSARLISTNLKIDQDQVISFNDLPGMVQLVNVTLGKEVYDVSVLPPNWNTLESNFRKHSPLRTN